MAIDAQAGLKALFACVVGAAQGDDEASAQLSVCLNELREKIGEQDVDTPLGELLVFIERIRKREAFSSDQMQIISNNVPVIEHFLRFLIAPPPILNAPQDKTNAESKALYFIQGDISKPFEGKEPGMSRLNTFLASVLNAFLEETQETAAIKKISFHKLGVMWKHFPDVRTGIYNIANNIRPTKDELSAMTNFGEDLVQVLDRCKAGGVLTAGQALQTEGHVEEILALAALFPEGVVPSESLEGGLASNCLKCTLNK